MVVQTYQEINYSRSPANGRWPSHHERSRPVHAMCASRPSPPFSSDGTVGSVLAGATSRSPKLCRSENETTEGQTARGGGEGCGVRSENVRGSSRSATLCKYEAMSRWGLSPEGSSWFWRYEFRFDFFLIWSGFAPLNVTMLMAGSLESHLSTDGRGVHSLKGTLIFHQFFPKGLGFGQYLGLQINLFSFKTAHKATTV